MMESLVDKKGNFLFEIVEEVVTFYFLEELNKSLTILLELLRSSLHSLIFFLFGRIVFSFRNC